MEIIDLDHCSLSDDCLIGCLMNKPEKVRQERRGWREIIRFDEMPKKLFLKG